MVKPAYENLAIDVWVHQQRLGVTQPSLCVFHDVLGVGGQILEALGELGDGACPDKRTLTFAASSRRNAMTQLKLWFVDQSEDLKVMSVRCDRDTATIEFTSVGLPLLIDAFSEWLRGSEDFGVSPRHSSLKPKEFGKLDRESGEVWFWGTVYDLP